jgi:hypothetical protein
MANPSVACSRGHGTEPDLPHTSPGKIDRQELAVRAGVRA